MSVEVDLDGLTVAAAGSGPELDLMSQQVAVALYRALGKGHPVSVAALAGRFRLGETEVAETLRGWPGGVSRDDAGDVIGFWGLASPEMAHGYSVGGRKLQRLVRLGHLVHDADPEPGGGGGLPVSR